MIRNYGNVLLRYKRILNISGSENRIIYQGIHMLLTETFGKAWKSREIEKPEVVVFIGRNLAKEQMHEALDSCRVLQGRK